MFQVKALNEETKQVLDFYVSDSMTDFEQCLDYIRYGWPRNWRRVNHSLISSEENSPPPRVEMKYVILTDESGVEHTVVFDKSINHDYMALAVQHMKEEYYKPVSAGFTNGILCYGNSETLRLDSREEDTVKVYG